ncbi:MAG: AEC family transporter [Alphaproteobacteria bacterium]
MQIFLTLFTNLIPLYILIALGFIAGRYLNVDRHSIANLVIYLCLPVVAFGFVSTLEFQLSYIFLPIIILAISSLIGLTVYEIGKRIFGDNRANLLSMCASMPNSGYFGLPLVILLFKDQPQWVGVYMFMMLGVTIYEATIGYYIAARGSYSVRDSIKKLIKFPALYAIALALIVNITNTQMPEQFYTYWGYFKGAYVVMGMMIIGVALASVEKLVIGPRFLSLAALFKFIAWPAIILALTMFDRAISMIFPPEIHRLMLILSIVPPAANIAAFAAQLNVQPEKAATTVLICTVLALIYIPFIVMITGL